MTHLAAVTDPDIDVEMVHEVVDDQIGAGDGILDQTEAVTVDEDGDSAVFSITDKVNADNDASVHYIRHLELRREGPWDIVGVKFFQEVNANTQGNQSFGALGADWAGASNPLNIQHELAVAHMKEANRGYFLNFEVTSIDWTWGEFVDLYHRHTMNANGDGTNTANLLNMTQIYLKKAGAVGSTI